MKIDPKTLTKQERQELRVKLGREAIQALGGEPEYWGVNQQWPKEYFPEDGLTPEHFDALVDLYCYLVTEEEPITSDTLKRAREKTTMVFWGLTYAKHKSELELSKPKDLNGLIRIVREHETLFELAEIAREALKGYKS